MSAADALARVLGLPDTDRAAFAQAVNRLLADTFILRDYDRATYTLLRRYQEQATAVLDLLDWTLVHDGLGHIFQARNRHDANRRPLKRLESELLVLLCLTYLEQRSTIQLADTPLITLADLRQKYRTLLGDTKRLTQTGLRDALATLRRYRLIEAPDGRRFNPQDPDSRLLLLPTLRLALAVERLEEIGPLLDRYRGAPDEDEP